MYNQKVKSAFEQANELYLTAKGELTRPVRDTVNYMVCLNALNAIRYYLTGFALQHGNEVQAETSLEELYEVCKKEDARFADLELNVLFKVFEDEYTWLDQKWIAEFIQRAENTRRLATPVV